MQFINWHEVIITFSPTHFVILCIGAIITHLVWMSTKYLAVVFRGYVLSEERRVIKYIHTKQRHSAKFGVCEVGDCYIVKTAGSQLSPARRLQV